MEQIEGVVAVLDRWEAEDCVRGSLRTSLPTHNTTADRIAKK